MSEYIEQLVDEVVELFRERIIKRFEACLCFEKYDCEDKRCTDIMQFIKLVKEIDNAY